MERTVFGESDGSHIAVHETPVGRLGAPEDCAAAALFLASEEAQFVSGVGFNVDGGAIVKF